MTESNLPTSNEYPYRSSGLDVPGRYSWGEHSPGGPPPLPAADDAWAAAPLSRPTADTYDLPEDLWWLAKMLTLAALAIVDLVAVPLLDWLDQRSLWQPLFLASLGAVGGVFAAQLTVLCVQLVLGTGSFARRLAMAWAAGLVFYVAWAASYSLTFRNGPQEIWWVLAGLPTVALAVQAPLWLLRIYAGWRLVRADQALRPSQTQMTISSLLGGTAVVAISFAALRSMYDQPADYTPPFWLAWLIGGSITAAASLMLIAPTIALVLRPSDWRIAAFGPTFYWLLLAAPAVVGLALWRPAVDWRELATVFGSASLVCLLATSAWLWFLRSGGWRLAGGR